jgi:hypothetical protein
MRRVTPIIHNLFNCLVWNTSLYHVTLIQQILDRNVDLSCVTLHFLVILLIRTQKRFSCSSPESEFGSLSLLLLALKLFHRLKLFPLRFPYPTFLIYPLFPCFVLWFARSRLNDF